jgi:hypothetical protein
MYLTLYFFLNMGQYGVFCVYKFSELHEYLFYVYSTHFAEIRHHILSVSQLPVIRVDTLITS